MGLLKLQHPKEEGKDVENIKKNESVHAQSHIILQAGSESYSTLSGPTCWIKDHKPPFSNGYHSMKTKGKKIKDGIL